MTDPRIRCKICGQLTYPRHLNNHPNCVALVTPKLVTPRKRRRVVKATAKAAING